MQRTINFQLLIITCLMFSITNIWFVKAQSVNPTLELNQSGKIVDSEFTVTVDLKDNEGIAGMLLTIVYDHSAMSLINAARGVALSSLDYATTNIYTEVGYGAENFQFIWDGIENDTTEGTLLTLRFKVKEEAEKGKYNISFTYTSDSDVFKYDTAYERVYLDLNINSCQINLKSNSYFIIIYCTIGIAVLIGFWIVLYIKKQDS